MTPTMRELNDFCLSLFVLNLFNLLHPATNLHVEHKSKSSNSIKFPKQTNKLSTFVKLFLSHKLQV